MADPLAGLRDAIERLPTDVTAALKGVAHDTAIRVQTRARQILLAKRPKAGSVAAAITIVDESAHHQYVVDSLAPSGHPPNLPLWLERGTVHMEARPYMRPAGDAEDDRYKREMLAAAEAVADRLEAL